MLFNPKNHIWIKACLILASLFLAVPAFAQTLVQNTPLDFGRFVIRDNSSQYDITLQNDGTTNASPNYIFFTQPQLGQYTVSGYPAGVTLDIVLNTSVVPPNGGTGPSFTLVNLFHVPTTVTTDGSGNATFQVGGTLRSDGSGTMYQDDSFQGSYTVSVSEE